MALCVQRSSRLRVLETMAKRVPYLPFLSRRLEGGGLGREVRATLDDRRGWTADSSPKRCAHDDRVLSTQRWRSDRSVGTSLSLTPQGSTGCLNRSLSHSVQKPSAAAVAPVEAPCAHRGELAWGGRAPASAAEAHHLRQDLFLSREKRTEKESQLAPAGGACIPLLPCDDQTIQVLHASARVHRLQDLQPE